MTLPTLVLFGSLEPEPGFFLVARPAAFFRRTLAGGVFMMKVNERSEYTVITTGMIMSPCAARPGVEVLAERHDVDAVLTEGGTDGRRRVGLARGKLQLDVTGDLLLARYLSGCCYRVRGRLRPAGV